MLSMLNKKGFTLIELLAVITILAILVLVALPAVTGLMNKSIMGSFRTDALSMAQSGIQAAYSTALLNGTVSTENSNFSDKKIHRINGADYLCMGISDLVENQFIQKNDYKNYGGYLQIKVETTGKTTIAINVTNGKYYIQTTYKKLSAAGDVTAQVVGTQPTGGARVGNYDCPAEGTMIATDDSPNITPEPIIKLKSSPLEVMRNDNYDFCNNLILSDNVKNCTCNPARAYQYGRYSVTCQVTGKDNKTKSLSFNAIVDYPAVSKDECNYVYIDNKAQEICHTYLSCPEGGSLQSNICTFK